MTTLYGPLNSGAAAGADGVATANTDSAIVLRGAVLGLYVRYNDSPPAGTTDITIATKGSRAPALTLLTIANAATDGWFWPRVQVHTTAGAAITATYDYAAIDDKINVNIAQANASDSIDVWLVMDD